VLAACVALSVPYVANAATVASVTGTVLISKGDGFAPLKSDTELPPGGQVLVRPDSVAMITYPSDCTVRVGAGVWQVQPKAPCANGTREIDFTGRMNDGLPEPVAAPPPPEVEGYDHRRELLIGAGIVGGGLLIACLVDWCKKEHKSSSP
jgi:hypothetical protein